MDYSKNLLIVKKIKMGSVTSRKFKRLESRFKRAATRGACIDHIHITHGLSLIPTNSKRQKRIDHVRYIKIQHFSEA